MPLSKPKPRKLIHTRRIQCQGFQRDDGKWDIEGEIIDTKTYSFDNFDRGGVAAGEPIHHMKVRLTVNDDMVIHKAEAVTEQGPYRICGDVTGVVATLEGAAIRPGWRREVFRRMGGVKGCTHITDLLVGPLAVTAHQAVQAARMKRKAISPDSGKPAQLNSCHAYAATSPIVERLWPEFHEKG